MSSGGSSREKWTRFRSLLLLRFWRRSSDRDLAASLAVVDTVPFPLSSELRGEAVLRRRTSSRPRRCSAS